MSWAAARPATRTHIVNPADALARRHDVDGDETLDLGAVVYVTGTLPWPVTSGGHLRTLGNLKALAAIAPTHLVAFPTEPGERPPIELASTTIWPVAAATRLGRLRHRLVATVRRRHPYVQRLMSQGGLEALGQVIENHRGADDRCRVALLPGRRRCVPLAGPALRRGRRR